jgi:RNA recognition motif-containing protein
MNIYVGNLSFDVVESDLLRLFESFGRVTSASIIKDKFKGRSRGFGFVEMPDDAEAQAAIDALNGKEMMNRTLTVNEARQRSERTPGGGDRRHGRSGGRRRY